MDQLASIRAFTTVIEAGGFARAARRLGCSTATVTRQVQDLEARLGVRLLVRTTRRVRPTDTGAAYHRHCQRILEDLAEADAQASLEAVEPRGVLRVSAPLSFGWHRLGAVVPGFMQAYPQVAVELMVSDRFVNLLDEGYDVAVRIGQLRDSMLRSRRLGADRLLLCASPDYVARYGNPRAPGDLQRHECLCYSYQGAGRRNTWVLWREGQPVQVTVSGRYEVNNGDLLREAAIGGLGIAYQPAFLIGAAVEQGELVRLLPDYDGSKLGIYAVYPHRTHLSGRLRAFLDYLETHLATL